MGVVGSGGLFGQSFTLSEMMWIMSTMKFKAWGHCIDCHFEGMIEYRHIEGEDYSDEQAVGVMLIQHCPSCDTTEHALIPIDYYQEMMEELKARFEDEEPS